MITDTPDFDFPAAPTRAIAWVHGTRAWEEMRSAFEKATFLSPVKFGQPGWRNPRRKRKETAQAWRSRLAGNHSTMIRNSITRYSL